MNSYKVSVDWKLGWGNNPVFVVEGPTPPTAEKFIYKAIPINSNNTLYYGECVDFVNFLLDDILDQTGYGGVKFILEMGDGTERTIKGPWSTRESVINKLGLGPVIGVMYNSNFCHMKLGCLIKNLPSGINVWKSPDGLYSPTIIGSNPIASKELVKNV